MNRLRRLLRWFRAPRDPALEAERHRMRTQRETIRTSQTAFGSPPNVPPTPDVLDPNP